MAGHFFNLYDNDGGIYRSLANGVRIQIPPGQHAMLSVVHIEAEPVSGCHSRLEEQWGVLLEGSGVRIQDDIEHAVLAGNFWKEPSGVSHSFRAGPEGALLPELFSPPRAEYRSQGPE